MYPDFRTKEIPVGIIAGTVTAGIVISVSLLVTVSIVVVLVMHLWRILTRARTCHHQPPGK